MAMYYYASKLNEASCSSCSLRVREVPPAPSEPAPQPPATELAPLSDPALMSGSGLSYYDDDYYSMVRGNNFRSEATCQHFVMNGGINFVSSQSNAQQPAVITPTVRTLSAQFIPEPPDVEYSEGHIISATIDGLVELLRPGASQSFTFTFLLCSRLFIKPHELLLKLCKKYAKYIDKLVSGTVEVREPPEREVADMAVLVRLLSQWMHMFPYDFRDDRVMALVRSITQRCASEHMDSLRLQVSSMLEKLLDKLTALEQYETTFKEVRIVATVEEVPQGDIITLGLTPAELANQLTIVELQRLSFVGPEEFVQAFAPTPPPVKGPPPKIPPPVKMTLPARPTTSGKPPTKNTISLHHGEKTTRNLEAYADWFNRLSYLVATDILKASKSKYRARVIEQWVMTARECFNLGNFNSMMAIIGALNMVPVARLKKTWARTSTVCGQQLRQLELCIEPSSNHARYRAALAAAPTETAVPLLSVTCRDLHFANQGAPSKLSGNRINFEKCAQLARHVCVQLAARRLAGEGAPVPSPAHPHLPAWRFLNETNVLNETALELMSFEREPPVDSMEKERMKRLREGI
ncbi:ras-GEF domain-containing family member 1B-like isoform X2 [Epargyreus clarus]|uniref:ras-GEF domain-containing family member 1B-like isoform X2 n=1 Tax=Epargyreus clarus TaxID=520877 RepID=UPI003C2E03BD